MSDPAENVSAPRHVHKPPPSNIRARLPENKSTSHSKPLNGPSIAQEAKQLRKRRLGVGAVAFAVIVVAGSILGARIKEAKQENDRRKDIESAAQDLLVAPPRADTASENTMISAKNNAPTKDSSPNSDQPKQMDIAKQIAMLEDRRALLTRYKRNYEDKIRMLQDRQAKQAEMDSRRPTEQG